VNARPTRWSLVLTVLGVALLAWWLFGLNAHRVAPWVIGAAAVAVAAWLARTIAAAAGAARTARTLALVAVAAGALASAATDGTAVIPAAVCLMVVVADDGVPIVAAAAAGLGAVALAALGAVIAPVSLPALLSIVGALLLGCLGGLSRRQLRTAERQAVLLRERDAAARAEAERVAIARDLHDVLAHTLGGLVLQLDAVDALLEAGDAASARERVMSARELAGAGLGEARRAVAALREPRAEDAPAVTPAALASALDELVRAHRALGGSATLRTEGVARTLPSATAGALERALQEALSNARRHAPGQPVEVGLAWQDDVVSLTVSNPVAVPASAHAGGGYGLIGMRERFAGLAGGAAEAGIRDGRFVVRVRADVS